MRPSRGALAVDDEVPVVGEGRAALEADLRPDVVAERLGRRHERVDRGDGAPPARDGRGVALGREDDVLGPHRAVRGDDAAAADVDGRGALVDRDTAALDRGGQTRARAGPGGSRRSAGSTSRRGSRPPGRTQRPRGRRAAGGPRVRSPRRGSRRPRRAPARAGRGCARRRGSRPGRSGSRCPPRRRCAPTAATVSCSWCCIRTAASRPRSLAIRWSDAGKSAEHQPPLRPEAPKPATSRSITATRTVGSATRGGMPSRARCSRPRRSRRRPRGHDRGPVAG